MRKSVVIAVFVLFSPASISLAVQVPGLSQAGDRVDLAAFGRPLPASDGTGVEWDTLHDIDEVRVTAGAKPLDPALRLEWWGSVWPDNGTGGWKKLDDPWNGKWVRLKAEPQSKAGALVFAFPPLAKEEWEHALASADRYDGKKVPSYRRTLKLRIVTADGKPAVGTLAAFSASRWTSGTFNVEIRHTDAQPFTGRIEVTNGRLVTMTSMASPRQAEITGNQWAATKSAGQTTGVTLSLLYVENPDVNSNDLTRVAVRLGKDPAATGFSFVPQDVLADDAMRVPSLGVLVSQASDNVTFANDTGPAGSSWDHPVRLRLTQQPEMTRAMAMRNIPRLAPLPWVPLGVPSARQEFFVSAGGDWASWGESLHTHNDRDWKRLVFRRNMADLDHDRLSANLDTRQQPRFDDGGRENRVRYLEQGYLPVMHVEWNTGPIKYHHALCAASLMGDYADDVKRRGDETVVLLGKLEITNTDKEAQPATVSLRYTQNAPISLGDDGMIAITDTDPAKVPVGLTALRGGISVGKPAGGGAEGWQLVPGQDPQCSAVLRYTPTLKPGETRVVYLKTPFVDLLETDELKRIREISYEQEVPAMIEYWRNRLSRTMAIETPDPAVNDFYRANLWHILITTDRDPKTGLYNQGVGTVGYRVFANETVMIAHMMDMRGEHIEAERYLEPMLHYQGDKPLKGRFSTKEGVFHSAGEYTHGEYAMNHGFVLWGVADHYFMTRDKAYLQRTAPQIIKGCDFLINERKSTMSEPGSVNPVPPPKRSPFHGLAPASSLEDVVEYEYWFAVNGYFYLGMKRVAQALTEIAHPQAQRIATEAENYRRDIEAAMREAITQAAAVRLRDGNYVPYVPSRVWHWRHLTEGWIREALYPALQLATAEVVAPDDPLITWMLDDLEDNIFFSWQSGLNVEDYEKTWFGKGALTLQPCLVDLPPIYMARDEVAAALRSFWNTYAYSIFPDVCCFTEWAKSFGRPGGPLYKTSDEARWVMWLRQLLIWEDGNKLWLGRGMPAEWLGNGKVVRVAHACTVFGEAGMEVRSSIDVGRIEAAITLPTRTPPAEAWLRLRHPEGKSPLRVFINDRQLAADQVVGQDIRLLPTPGLDASKPVRIVAEYAFPK